MKEHKIIDSIAMISNGILVNYHEDDEEIQADRIAYTYSTELERCEAIVNMFYDMLNVFRPNSKHNKYNIRITIENDTEKSD